MSLIYCNISVSQSILLRVIYSQEKGIEVRLTKFYPDRTPSSQFEKRRRRLLRVRILSGVLCTSNFLTALTVIRKRGEDVTCFHICGPDRTSESLH